MGERIKSSAIMLQPKGQRDKKDHNLFFLGKNDHNFKNINLTVVI
jgi:hypothetical protein